MENVLALISVFLKLFPALGLIAIPQRFICNVQFELSDWIIARGKRMAARKPMMGPNPARDELARKVQRSLAVPMTEDEYAEQRVSFAFGNAPNSDFISKDSVRRAIHSFRLKEAN